MRPFKAVVLLACLVAMGTVQASSKNTVLRISLTIVDRCDIRDGHASPSVDCSTGVPWTVASPAAAAAVAPSLVADGTHASHLPVPRSGPIDGARVTTIVF
ncbi:hypothetical protein [Pseudoxanthomonas suwonensis]|uniref:Secreted protein n=1 Tax=Pseudoxanthomonas suwonensis TaxID=314722 RepID=A0A0E3Z2N9_9GAMM|nr:hypothetical protein [Pseudoxanthomonas suwonensis]AKC87504.1 hypothetical protein WQ53_12800 [Pseudoxanthomonas suwonensis]